MHRFAMPSITLVLLLWVASASAHGRHHGRQYTAKGAGIDMEHIASCAHKPQ